MTHREMEPLLTKSRPINLMIKGMVYTSLRNNRMWVQERNQNHNDDAILKY
jgi:hypothetical protein